MDFDVLVAMCLVGSLVFVTFLALIASTLLKFHADYRRVNGLDSSS